MVQQCSSDEARGLRLSRSGLPAHHHPTTLELPHAIPLLDQLSGVPKWVVGDCGYSSHGFREHIWTTRRTPHDTDPPHKGTEHLAMNSGPLSERNWPGMSRRMNSLESTLIAATAFSLRDARIAKHSRVNSSTTFSIRNLRSSCVRASTKSSDQT